VKALATIAQIYKLPAVITTSAAEGPNGPVMPVVAEGPPKATVVHRPDEFGAADLGLDARGAWQSPPEVVAADQDVRCVFRRKCAAQNIISAKFCR